MKTMLTICTILFCISYLYSCSNNKVFNANLTHLKIQISQNSKIRIYYIEKEYISLNITIQHM